MYRTPAYVESLSSHFVLFAIEHIDIIKSHYSFSNMKRRSALPRVARRSKRGIPLNRKKLVEAEGSGGGGYRGCERERERQQREIEVAITSVRLYGSQGNPICNSPSV
jgi:hypothetical protein